MEKWRGAFAKILLVPMLLGLGYSPWIGWSAG